MKKPQPDESFLEWCVSHWDVTPSPNENILPPSLDAQKALYFLQSYLLGDDWMVAMPLSTGQVNTEIVNAILTSYSKSYRKELKKYGKRI